jgi:hypothetical protein
MSMSWPSNIDIIWDFSCFPQILVPLYTALIKTDLLYTYFNRKRRLHINPQHLEIPTLIKEKRKRKNYPHCHYNFVVKSTPINNSKYLRKDHIHNQIGLRLSSTTPIHNEIGLLA